MRRIILRSLNIRIEPSRNGRFSQATVQIETNFCFFINFLVITGTFFVGVACMIFAGIQMGQPK